MIQVLFSQSEVEYIVKKCLDEFLEKDFALLQYDVSERAITHKLAEYLQDCFPKWNVDCEYNRNSELREYMKKKLYILKDKRWIGLDEDERLAISPYPDIVVHHRGNNNENLLIVEVKKRKSRADHNYDHEKLAAFTGNSKWNKYHYKYGVFILLDTGEKPQEPELTWFVDGKFR